MPDFTAAQWGFAGLITIGLLLSVVPWEKVRGLFARVDLPDMDLFADDRADDPRAVLLDLMGHVVDLQAALEARGHSKEAEALGSIYPLLRSAVKEDES